METKQSNYVSYWKNKLETSAIYQDFIVDLLATKLNIHIQQYTSRPYQMKVGESRQGIEIKHDEKYAETGNLWIETGERWITNTGDYKPSGIYRNDNSWLYVIGNYKIVFVFAHVVLKGLVPHFPLRENKTKTSIGYCLPHKHAMKWASVILHPMAQQEMQNYIQDNHNLLP